jgi:hypothetical protein
MASFKACAKAYSWSLKEIEETNLESLLEFWAVQTFEAEKTINGKKYTLAAAPPAFL